VGNIDSGVIVRYAECMSTDSRRCDKYRTCRTRKSNGDSFSIFYLDIIDNLNFLSDYTHEIQLRLFGAFVKGERIAFISL
jgi:hypothetical protein